MVDHILRRNADDILDVSRAIGKFEAASREERHRMKNKGANKKGRLTKGGGSLAAARQTQKNVKGKKK